MTGHTKEPWAYASGPAYNDLYHTVEGADETMVCECWDGTSEQDEANARRIVDCVNALAGIPDPLAFVEAARGMNRLAQNFRDMLEAHCANIGEGLCAEDQAVFDGWKAELTAFRAQLGDAALARGEGV